MKKTTLIVFLIFLSFGTFFGQSTFPPPTIPLENFDLLSGPVYYPNLRYNYGIIPPEPEPYKAVDEFEAGLSALYTAKATNDANDDVEPSVMSLTLGSTDYTTTTYIKRVLDGIYKYRNYFSTTTDFVNFTGGQLSLPADYSWSADPMVDANIYGTGIAPRRIYCTGIIYNGPPIVPPNSIALWHTDNGGLSWSSPTVVSRNDSSQYFLDKPDIAVSWASGTIGYVYVAYIKYNNLNPTQNQLLVSRSTDGGLTFGPPVVVTTGYIGSPQILVNPFFGYAIYALWVDFTQDEIYKRKIKMSRSLDYGQTWPTPETVSEGYMMKGNDRINGNVRASTVPMARFNSVMNKICVVWHEREQYGSNLTDVYYTAKSSSGWQSKVRINDVQTNDQFMPALDFDTSGNLKVTFYDRRDDTTNPNKLYHLYVAHINSNGTNLRANERVSTFQSNPQAHFDSFIGDYQDIWDWTFLSGQKYNASWIGIPSVGDVYLSGIQP